VGGWVGMWVGMWVGEWVNLRVVLYIRVLPSEGFLAGGLQKGHFASQAEQNRGRRYPS
jgi:hypothetical protein